MKCKIYIVKKKYNICLKLLLIKIYNNNNNLNKEKLKKINNKKQEILKKINNKKQEILKKINNNLNKEILKKINNNQNNNKYKNNKSQIYKKDFDEYKKYDFFLIKLIISLFIKKYVKIIK